MRSYEATHVGGLWHLDFHHGSLKILSPQGEWVRPLLLAILDDHSRLICHAQWYYGETAECLIHEGTSALQRRLRRYCAPHVLAIDLCGVPSYVESAGDRA